MVIIVATASAFFGAIGNIYLKKLFSNSSIKELLPINFFLNTLLMLLFLPFYFSIHFSQKGAFFLILAFVMDALANYYYYKAIDDSPVSYVTVLISTSPMFTLLASTLLADVISLKSLISVIGIIISVYILNISKGMTLYEPIRYVFKNHNYYSLLCAIFSGISAVLTKLVLNENFTNSPTLYLFRSAFLFLVFLIFLRPSMCNLNFHLVLSIFARVLIVTVNMLLYLYAISLGNVIVVTAINSISPAFVLVLAYFFLKEKITFQKGAAILSIMFFIMMLSYNFSYN